MVSDSLTGTVSGIYASSKADLEGIELERATLKFGGMEKDTRHFGITKSAGVRESQYEKGTEIYNYRQISLVSEEELATITQKLDVPEIKPEWVGANIMTKGIPELTRLPPTTRLFFEHGPTIVIFGENTPCLFAGKAINKHYNIPNLETSFVKAAMYKRGCIGWVEKEGIVQPGDTVTATTPKFVTYELPKDE